MTPELLPALLRGGRRAMTAVATTILFACCVVSGSAQPSYTMELDTATYTPLPGKPKPFPVSPFALEMYTYNLDDDALTLFGREYQFGSTLTVSSGGNVTIDNGQQMAMMYALGSMQYFAADSLSGLTTRVDGPQGDRVIKIQWGHARCREGSGAGVVNVQLWLHHRTGIIEFRYGPMIATHDTSFNTTHLSALLSAPSDLEYVNESMCLKGDPMFPSFDSARVVDMNGYHALVFPAGLQSPPMDGMVYRFVPTSASSVEKDAATGNPALYPNPTSGVIEVSGLAHGTPVTVYDMLGRAVLQHRAEGGAGRIDISSQPSGSYMVVTPEKSWRVVKQ